MAHEFTSGVLLNNTPAWHGLGEVIAGTLPARDAFVRAGALFPVDKLQLWAGDPSAPEQMISLADQRQAIWRPDTRKILGTTGPDYQIIPNERLLQFAEVLREEADMDAVVVLREGAKIAFTAKLRGLELEVVPGDKLHRNVVGYLGHDGKTSFGGMFTDIRVVCANTLGFAQSDAERTGKQFRIRHTANDIAQVDHVLANIDMARQSFAAVVDEYRELQAAPMNLELYRHWLEQVYQPAATEERPGRIEDMPRKWAQLEHAWNYGLGRDIPGVAGTVYWGLNAVTEVETSGLTKGAGRRRVHSTLFGAANSIVKRARETALALV